MPPRTRWKSLPPDGSAPIEAQLEHDQDHHRGGQPPGGELPEASG
ncbi:MAG TPA: hypothetical protein VGG40_08130 [Solirubrobacterales bacterium]